MRSLESSLSGCCCEDGRKGSSWPKSLCRWPTAVSTWTSFSQHHSSFFLFQPVFSYTFLFRKSSRSEIKSGTRNRSKSTVLTKVRWELVLIKSARFLATWVEGEMRTKQVGKKVAHVPIHAQLCLCEWENGMKWRWVNSVVRAGLHSRLD